MHRFWDTIIKPVLEALQPQSIVEIASDQGFNTGNLLEFCRLNEAKLHVIDPLPNYDIVAWQERHGKHVAFQLVRSLDAIPLIDRFDVVLIDGDHNWYTVFSELKLIERQCKELSQPFPVVLIHDIGWPYGRRDLYYNPETIPDAYGRPFRRKGMHPESAELLEEGGPNQHLFNAIHENTLQSGVLAALEAFMEETEQQLKLVKIPGIHGLGILAPLHLEEQNEELARLLKALDCPPVVTRHIDRVERVRLETEIRLEEEHHAALGAKESEAKYLRKTLAKRDRQLKRKESELYNIRRQADRQAKQGSREIMTLIRQVEQLDKAISALLNSRRWKFGHAFGELYRKIRRRPEPTVQNNVHRLLQQFPNWRETRKRAPVGVEDLEKKSSKDSAKDLAIRKPGHATSDEPSPSTSTVGLSNTKGLERRWCFKNRPPQGKTKTKVSVISWDMTHNPVGRALWIAGSLSRKFDVEIVGARFPKYGTEIWEPIRDEKIPTIDFVGQKFPAHFAEMEELAKHIDGDIIIVSKPRLPSYELGILAKHFKNRPLILDVDDPELAFYGGENEGLTLDEVKALQKDRKQQFLNPCSKLWTQYCESIIPYADHLTVSNLELQKKYGGTIFPHVKDERKFDPALYDRDSIRARFGFIPEDKVVLFIGTPRLHKGILEIAEALEKIGNPRYKLCIIGTIKDDEMNARLKRLKGDHVRLFKNQPYSDLPANLRIGDLVCLLQKHESQVARYQMPSKFTDALAMEIPILATEVPPLKNLASSGLVELLGHTPLDQKIDEIFSNYAPFKRKAVENRKVFLEEYSYAAAAEKLESVVLPLLDKTPPIPDEFERLLKFHREVFSPLADSANGRVAEKPHRETTSRGLIPQDAVPHRQAVGAGETPRYVDDKYDIVFFWKQNDTGIYGRRQDMIVKHLSESPKVNRIVHFDAPIEAAALHSLLDLSEEEKLSQANLVFSQTVSRLLGLEHSEKVKHYTFVYGAKSSPVGLMPQPLPKRKGYLDYLKNVLSENGIGRRRTIFWVCPVNFDFPNIARAFDPDLIVADVIDDNRTWNKPGSEQWEKKSRNYEEILGMSELVLTNCQPLKQTMLAYTDEIHVIPNAAELPGPSETRQEPPEELKRMRGPILGYVGNLSSRIDIDLLEYIAMSRPEWNIVLIGSSHLSKEVLRLDVYSNVHFLGVKRYSEVQPYIANFDVALIPHVDNEMTQSMNPLKLFVYASMNVPIVSTEIENLGELGNLVYTARDKDDFVEKVELALKQRRIAEPGTKHMELLRENSWEVRVEKILALIDEKFDKESHSVSGQPSLISTKR